LELELSEDQEFFRETTASFLASECPLEQVRALAKTEAGFDRSLWRKGAELGWTSLLVPEEDGGGSVSGRGLVDLTLVAYEFGRLTTPGPLVPSNVIASALARSGSADQKAKLLPGILTGESVAAWCLAEPHPHEQLGEVQVRARAVDDGFVLDGTKFPVESGADAEWFLVTARSENGLTQLIVPAATQGVRIARASNHDLVRRFAEVSFDSVQVPSSAVLGQPGGADADVEHQLQVALVIQLAECVGAAQEVFGFSLDWVNNRYSFGRPISSYQEIKHRFADMRTWLEASHAIADAAASAVQDGAEDAGVMVSAAKAYVGDHIPELVQDCVQMHGGIGVTYEADIHLYLRRVTENRALFGTPDEHRERLAQHADASVP
jgi:alkylation response protein AidB-like acyl-CoA dehydrogenase